MAFAGKTGVTSSAPLPRTYPLTSLIRVTAEATTLQAHMLRTLPSKHASRNVSVGAGLLNMSKWPQIRALVMERESTLTLVKAQLYVRTRFNFSCLVSCLFAPKQSYAQEKFLWPVFHLVYFSHSITSTHTNDFPTSMLFPINRELLFYVRSVIILLRLLS